MAGGQTWALPGTRQVEPWCDLLARRRHSAPDRSSSVSIDMNLATTSSVSPVVVECSVIEPVAHALENLTAPDWLIKWLIESSTIGQIFAGSNVGKSALAVEIACRVAAGMRVAGRRTKTGSVLYVAMEGMQGLRRRFKAWEIFNDVMIPESIYQTTIPTLLPDANIEAKLLEARDRIVEAHGILALVVLDTLAVTIRGDQKHGADMIAYLGALKRLFPVSAVMLLHHVGHIEKSRSRGASELPAACDWEFRLETVKSFDAGVIRLKNIKQRDARLHKDVYFKLTPVTLGSDEDGDEFGSVVAEYLPSYEVSERVRGPSPTGSQMLKSLNELMDERRQQLEVSSREVQRIWILVDEWRKSCIRAGVNDSTFRTNKSALIQKRLIDIDGVYVSAADT